MEKEGYDFIKCEICGIKRKMLASHLHYFHKINKEKYFSMFPNAKIWCQKSLNKNSENNHKWKHTKEAKRKISMASKNPSKETRKKIGEATKRDWKNPNCKKRKFFASKEWKEKNSKMALERWKDPIIRERYIKGIQEIVLRPEIRTKRSHSKTYCGSHYSKQSIRKDLGFFVRSSWEADFARILNYLSLDYKYEKVFELSINDNIEVVYTKIK